ncbi:MAG: metal ABC transporter substrate-binding protein [Dehalococcoidia bacterium]|nr:metal ABC transporter substrate-binding protein [Dehalococcoidia bacterium]
MKKILSSIATLIIMGTVLISCSDDNSDSSTSSSSTENTEVAKIEVSATIFPIYDIARQIAGDEIEVHLLITPGESPHTFNPTPSTKEEIEHSEIIFAIGNELDTFVTDISSNQEKIIIVDKNLTLIKYEDEHDDHDDDKHGDEKHDDHDHHAHGEYDPHYWLDPMNAKVMAVTIADALAQLDPANAESYNSRSSAFAAEIDALHTELVELAELAHDKSFITFHDSMAYLVTRYDLSLAGTFEPTGAEEPSPQYLHELSEVVEHDNVLAIFSEPQLSSASLEPFMKDNNLSLATLDPLGGVDGRDSYQALIRYNIETIAETLKEK